MWRQLKQVAATYLTRPTPLEWVGYAFFALAYLYLTLKISTHNKYGAEAMIFPALCGMIASQLFSNQLGWQFCHPRSRLIPRFQLPHLIVWAVLTVTFCVVLPLVAAYRSSISAWPVLCGTAIAVAAGIVPNLAQFALLPVIVLIPLGDHLLDEQTIQAWMNADGYRRPLLMGVTGLAWTATVWRARRLGAITEDDPHYVEPVVADPNAKVSRPFRLARQRAASVAAVRSRRSSAWTTAWLDRKLRRAAHLPVWKRLDIVFFERQSPTTQLAMIAYVAVIYAVGVFSSRTGTWDWDAERLQSLWFVAALATASAGLAPGARLGSRIPQMRAERLLPMSNQTYADALLRVCLKYAIQSWIALLAVVAVTVFALPWQGLEAPSFGNIAAYLAVSLAGLIYCYGVGLFCSSMQGCFSVVFAAATGVLVALGLQGHWASLREHDSRAFAIFLTVACTAAGLAFVYRARQLWRHKEFGSPIDSGVT